MSDFSKCSEQEAIFLASNVTSQSERAANCFRTLAKFKSKNVLLKIVKNDSTPKDVLEFLSKSDFAELQEIALEKLGTESI